VAPEHSFRPAWAEISESALRQNVHALQSVLGPTSLCGVVKANGYGHGMVLVADALVRAGVHHLAVATLDEGIELRDAGVTVPILLLSEIPTGTVADALTASLTITIGSLEGARGAVEQAVGIAGSPKAHLKVDTGMHRMGVAPDDVNAALEILGASDDLDVEGIYTHLSVADESSGESRGFTREQIDRFDKVLENIDPRLRPRVVHIANSAGALAYPQARRDLARVGLALYGYLPESWLGAALEENGVVLEPAMSLKARVVATRRVLAGGRPSYGRRRALERDATIVTIPFGYADGFSRKLFDAGADVLIHAKRYPLAGVVTMDQLVVDVGDDDVRVGDEVVLLGSQGNERISGDEWAQRGETITWEILCAVGARVPRVLVD
jgi:alanine racemase